MPLKIMCAGCPKDEREPAETSVKAALAGATGSWTVSLVKIGRQWSMTVDGPEIKHKTVVVPEGGIKQAIQELLLSDAPAPAPRAPAPPTLSAPVGAPAARPTASVPAPAPARPPRPAAPAPAPRAPLPPSRPAPAPAAPRTRPRPAAKSGERQDRYDCQFCGGVFLVIYESSGSSSQETVAVACPHCWKNSHVMVSEDAAISRDYRAEKA